MAASTSISSLADSFAEERYCIKLAEGLETLAKKCYGLIVKICKDNLSNKRETFNNIHLFFHHIGYIEGAAACLSECLRENETLLFNLYAKELE
jgi:hypothetical protein